jgi:hypothetical protein
MGRQVSRSELRWSIRCLYGQNLFDLYQATPYTVLSHEDVTDVPARFVADPFAIFVHGNGYLFFEVLNDDRQKGEIGLALFNQGVTKYKGIVLSAPFHLSYPYVFRWKSSYYMMPEAHESGCLSLYRAKEFPYDWQHYANLEIACAYADPSIIRYRDHWWLFFCDSPERHDGLRLFYSARLLGQWKEHPQSPLVIENPRTARPAGRIVNYNRHLVRFCQDCSPHYGSRVQAFIINSLSVDAYEEVAHETFLLQPGREDWNAGGMHHIDAHRIASGKWLAFVDGLG